MARLVLFPCCWPSPLSPLLEGVVFGGVFASVALYARKVANMYPGPVELPSLSVVLIT